MEIKLTHYQLRPSFRCTTFLCAAALRHPAPIVLQAVQPQSHLLVPRMRE
jgi:hypothetical protein